MNAVNAAMKLDWAGWLRGVLGAAISGGAGAVSAGFGVTVMDPKDWSPAHGGGIHLLELMGVCFAFSSVISLMKFLQSHPTPEPDVIPAPPTNGGPQK